MKLDFKQKVDIALIQRHKNRTWLVEQVRERTGLFLDSQYLSKLLNGKKHSVPLISAICEILDIKEGE